MLCEKCKQNQATVHVQQVINGTAKELHLCQDCAAQTEALSFQQFFQELINVFASPAHMAAPDGQLDAIKSMLDGNKCPTCGMTFLDFRNGGKLGCADCYGAFRNEIDSVLKNVQAGVQHQGKFPQRAGAELLTRKKVDQLRLLLSKAVENEQYEDAAKLRDQIREMEAAK
ncbi:MAG: UvrB/UvrC motif-containing protein [Defluviitaleaceae bacterium]|nr:UvrB/UvrC motif-containing protein [Defluviitaleaceae bacterium]